ncbi:hypothetical protein DH2020_006675 [Rehmannia glutinosa]|uniref:Peptidase M16C associated domain-containing protein n=1 Tax=Rehmannia glutinosa TaxID=99300 RepID=A0ABR0XK44_REHGL
MERAVLLRSLSSSSSSSALASTRLFSRSVHRLPKRHRLVPNVHRRSLLRRHLGLISPVSRPSLQLNRHFCPLSVRAVSTSTVQSSPEFLGADDDVADKLGFEKVSEEFIEECKSRAVLYKHKKTGAEIMSVSNDDENKVFGVVFRTPPKDSTGIPHILEHSVLCGSRKYPLKEPFVELLKGSLNTFLNAFTYPDRTCYPVASTNTKDFYNLVDVYLDAVFFPKCVEDIKTFQQEGWHYELNDPLEDITYKGVVFNEMKGVYSQPDSILGRASQQEFHRKYYHPSNARIWFYGDDDPNERLRILSEYLDMFEANSAPEESRVGSQKLFSEPVRIVEKYPAAEGGDLKKKHMVCLNWLLSETPLDLETELALGFLDHLMMGTPASPLRKILLESGLGDAIVGGGVEDELLQPQFSIGLKGVSEDNIQKVEELIMTTLKELAEEGFNSDAVEASMNTIEFSLRENNTGSFPRGLALMLRSIGKWIYDMDPFQPLKYQEPLKALKARIAEEGSKAVFAPLIEKFILSNPHRVTIEMQPDPEKASRDEAAEKENLEKVKASMTEEDLAELARATHELKLKQETPDPPEALKCVPTLSLEDIPKKPIHIPTEVGDINGTKVLQHDLFTNDVLYAEVVFNMSSLKQELLPLVPLFCQSLLEMGTKDMDFVQLNQLIGRKTGGISVYPFTSSVRGKEDPCSRIIVRGKAMSERAEDLFNLVNSWHLLDNLISNKSSISTLAFAKFLVNCVIQDVQLTDQKRFKQFVSQSKARMENRLRGSGHGIAAARMDAKLNVAGWVSEKMGGVSYLEFLQALEKKVDDDWPEISSSLEEIRRTLISKNDCLINLTADGKNLQNTEKYVSKFLDMLPNNSPVGSTAWSARLPHTNEALVIPTQVSSNVHLLNYLYIHTCSIRQVSLTESSNIFTQVNYVGKAANLFETGYQLKGSAYVISKYLNNSWLWDRVRVSGGAYGGFCDFDTHSGVFSFLSYRDPNLLKTLDVYDGTSNFLRELEMDDDALTKAIIGTIGDVDSYQLPDAKGYSRLNDFKEFADFVEAVKDKGVVVAVASPDDVDAANNTQGALIFKKVGRNGGIPEEM